MNNRHLVDGDLLPLLDMSPVMNLNADTLPAIRAAVQPLGEIVAPEAVERTLIAVPSQTGGPDVSLVLYRPAGEDGPLPCIFHIHGGGFVGGTVEMMEPIHRRLVIELDCVIASVDYRLAPETPFPGPLDDCAAALDWVFAHSAERLIDARRIGIMGESAGGGLAAGLALRTRDNSPNRVAFLHLAYPMLDDRTCTRADLPDHAGAFLWTRENNSFGWTSYLGKEPGADDISPYAAPARASDLAGLPPTFLFTGALDLFADESINFANRLARAGVPLDLHVFAGAFHGFDIDPSTGVAGRATQISREALRRFLHLPKQADRPD